MMLFAMSDVVWQALIAAVLAVVMYLLQAWKEGRDKVRAATVAKEVQQVSEVLATTSSETKVKLDEAVSVASSVMAKQDETLAVVKDTVNIVHENMAVQLRQHALTSRRLAKLTNGTPDGDTDAQIAETADRFVREHELKQATDGTR